MTYAEIITARIDFDTQPAIQQQRAAFEAAYTVGRAYPASFARYPWHGIEPRPGEYIAWDVERAWREWVGRYMEAA